jgi:hypothetical protein
MSVATTMFFNQNNNIARCKFNNANVRRIIMNNKHVWFEYLDINCTLNIASESSSTYANSNDGSVSILINNLSNSFIKHDNGLYYLEVSCSLGVQYATTQQDTGFVAWTGLDSTTILSDLTIIDRTVEHYISTNENLSFNNRFIRRRSFTNQWLIDYNIGTKQYNLS